MASSAIILLSLFIYGENAYRIQNEKNSVTMQDTDKLLQWLRKEQNRRGYIVQRRQQLASIGHRPFDIRIMVQRKKAPASAWKVTGNLFLLFPSLGTGNARHLELVHSYLYNGKLAVRSAGRSIWLRFNATAWRSDCCTDFGQQTHAEALQVSSRCTL